MTFEEIFSEPGLYRAEGFDKGVCFEVTENTTLLLVYYKSSNDISPNKHHAIMHKELFKKDYEKVYTKQSLFKD